MGSRERIEALLAMLGHDLRNPGTALVSCVEYLDEIVRDPEGREALQDAHVALGQLRTAWARIDALAGRLDPRWSRFEDVAPAIGRIAAGVGARYEGPPHLEAPAGVVTIVEALAEVTRGATFAASAGRLSVVDPQGPLPEPLRARAFEVEAQPELKRIGRYARFAGLPAAGRVAAELGLALRAGDDALFELAWD